MTQQEFAQWVKYHGTVVPSFGDWLRKLPPFERDEMLAAWYSGTTLMYIELDDAKEGSRRMLRGKRPFHFDEQVGEVCRLAIEAASERASKPTTGWGPQWTEDGERVFRCRFCLDTRGSWVRTAHPDLVRWFEQTYEEPPFPSNWRREWCKASPRPRQDGTLLCPCRHPGVTEVHFERDGSTVAVFNPERDCQWAYPVEDAVAKFVRSRTPEFAEGYFDE